MVCKSRRRPATKSRARSRTIYDSGFFRALSRILVTSPRYVAPQRGPGLSGNLDSSAIAQLVGPSDALAGGVHPPGKGASLDGHFHPGHTVPSWQTEV